MHAFILYRTLADLNKTHISSRHIIRANCFIFVKYVILKHTFARYHRNLLLKMSANDARIPVDDAVRAHVHINHNYY